MAMRKPGPYAPLYANYADDERIMEVGEDAELLYVRMLAYAARTPKTEGWISDAVIQSRLGILPRYDESGIVAGTDAGSRAGRLAGVGLITRRDNGYFISSWLKWNRSAEEMEREQKRDQNRKKPPTSTNDGTDAGSRAGNDAGLPVDFPPAEAEAEAESDQKHLNTRTGSAVDVKPKRKSARNYTPDFERFWKEYPVTQDKPKAFDAWQSAIQRDDPENIIAGAIRYREDPNRDPGHSKYAQGWLTGDRWNDGPLPARHTGGTVSFAQQRESRIHELHAQAQQQDALEQPPFDIRELGS